jgi:ABC-2 type transport system ATP-binding protein
LAIIADGKIVAEGTPDSLGDRETAETKITFTLEGASVDSLPLAGVTVAGNGKITVLSQRPTEDVHALAGWAIERGIELGDLSVARPSLEDVYLALTGSSSQD